MSEPLRSPKLRSWHLDRVTNLLAVLCVVGWRVFWLTMVARATPDAPAETALTADEIDTLDRLATPASPTPGGQTPKRTVSHYVVEIAKLGGYLAREKDPPPGNMVVWRGLTRLADILLGFGLGSRIVGN